MTNKADEYKKELRAVIEKQLDLIEQGASIDEKAENTIKFNEISQKIIDDNEIDSSKRSVMLMTISVFTNIFIDSLKRNKDEEKRLEELDKAVKVLKKENQSAKEEKPLIYSDEQFRTATKKG